MAARHASFRTRAALTAVRFRRFLLLVVRGFAACRLFRRLCWRVDMDMRRVCFRIV